MKIHLQSAIKSGVARRWIVPTLLCALNLAFIPAGQAQSSPAVSPSDIEAAYLYNFGKFIDWPSLQPDAASPQFSICIVGKDDFGSALDSIVQNDKVKGRDIVIKRLPTVSVADGCQILFLASSERSRLAKDLDTLKEKPVLTVSTIPDFLDRGGMVQFIMQENRVRFAVNLASATHVHLTLSSELLKVAVFVNPKPSQEGQ
jgi:hypothetical protein